MLTGLACNQVDYRIRTPTPFDVIRIQSRLHQALRWIGHAARWIEYERALSSVMLGPIGNTVPDLTRDHGLCEWIFMGAKGEQVYAWAECANDEGSAVSAPVVIFLGRRSYPGGRHAARGMGNLKDLFPDMVVDVIYSDPFKAQAAMEHIQLRRADPSIPPIIVLEGQYLP